MYIYVYMSLCVYVCVFMFVCPSLYYVCVCLRSMFVGLCMCLSMCVCLSVIYMCVFVCVYMCQLIRHVTLWYFFFRFQQGGGGYKDLGFRSVVEMLEHRYAGGKLY